MYTFQIYYLLIFLIQLTYADWKLGINGVNIEVQDKSGQITISSNLNKIMIAFKELREVDKFGNSIGIDEGTSLKHYFRSFLYTTFGSSNEEYIQYKGLGNNVTVLRKNYTAELSGPGAKVDFQIYVFNNTTMFPGANFTEYYQVYNGTVKFTFTITNWPFCGIKGSICKNKNNVDEIGAFLDVYMTIQGNRGPIVGTAKSRGDFGTRPITYYYGGGDISYSYKYFSNNTWKEMQDYPRMTNIDNNDVVVFRFPVFDNSVYYDPVINITSTWYISSATKCLHSLFFQMILCSVGITVFTLGYDA